jgi:hypothetical protein
MLCAYAQSHLTWRLADLVALSLRQRENALQDALGERDVASSCASQPKPSSPTSQRTTNMPIAFRHATLAGSVRSMRYTDHLFSLQNWPTTTRARVGIAAAGPLLHQRGSGVGAAVR